MSSFNTTLAVGPSFLCPNGLLGVGVAILDVRGRNGMKDEKQSIRCPCSETGCSNRLRHGIDICILPIVVFNETRNIGNRPLGYG